MDDTTPIESDAADMPDEIVKVYFDGIADPNPGPGRWAFQVIDIDGSKTGNSGHSTMASNSEMELLGACKALNYLADHQIRKAIVFTDSDYVRRGIREWIPTWIHPEKGRKPWTTQKGEPVKNKSLWIELYTLTQRIEVEWSWVKAYNSDLINEQANESVIAARESTQQLLAESRLSIDTSIFEDTEGFIGMMQLAIQQMNGLFLNGVRMYRTYAICRISTGFLLETDVVVEELQKSLNQQWTVDLEYVEQLMDDADYYMGIRIGIRDTNNTDG